MNFFSFLTKKIVPSRAQIQTLTTAPLSWLGVGVVALLSAIVILTYILLITLNNRLLVAIPAHDGVLTEGVIGAPHLINPVLARTETDVELSTLIYSGLVAQKADGSFIPVLAERYVVSPDNRTYTFTLRPKLQFHDKKPLTSADVAYTFKKLADYTINPSAYDYWQNISITTPDTTTVSFALLEPRADFLDHVTIGILPAHIWENIPDENFDSAPENSNPIGAGPFMFKNMARQNDVPEQIVLKRNPHFALGKSYLSEFHIAFFANQTDLSNALENNDIDFSFAVQPATTAGLSQNKFTFTELWTPHTITLFRLKGDPSFNDQRLVDIVNQFIDREHIIAIVESGYGIVPDILGAQTSSTNLEVTLNSLKAIGYTQQNGILQKNGVPTGFSIAVENDPSLLSAAQALRDDLGTIGIAVTIQGFDPGNFDDSVHANEYHIILASAATAVPSSYEKVLALYTKTLLFVANKNAHVFIPEPTFSSLIRYGDAHHWYTKTDKVWKWFVQQK